MLPIELADVRGHFTRRPLPDGLFEELLLVTEIKIDHERVLYAKNNSDIVILYPWGHASRHCPAQ